MVSMEKSKATPTDVVTCLQKLVGKHWRQRITFSFILEQGRYYDY